MSCQASFDHAVLRTRRGQLTGRAGLSPDTSKRAKPRRRLHLLGVIRHQQGDHEAAIELIGRAIALDPQNAVYRNNYGLPLHALGRFAEALDSFRRALEIHPEVCPGPGEPWHGAAVARTARGRHGQLRRGPET